VALIELIQLQQTEPEWILQQWTIQADTPIPKQQQAQINAWLSPYQNKIITATQATQWQAQIIALDWVADAQWQVIEQKQRLTIQAHQVLARWLSAQTQRLSPDVVLQIPTPTSNTLLNKQGQAFQPDDDLGMALSLLAGTEAQRQIIAQAYTQWQMDLESANLYVQALYCDAMSVCWLRLHTGLHLIMNHPTQSLLPFMAWYQNLPPEQQQALKRIDLRHHNGMLVANKK
jgi:hypothetical protein